MNSLTRTSVSVDPLLNEPNPEPLHQNNIGHIGDIPITAVDHSSQHTEEKETEQDIQVHYQGIPNLANFSESIPTSNTINSSLEEQDEKTNDYHTSAIHGESSVPTHQVTSVLDSTINDHANSDSEWSNFDNFSTSSSRSSIGSFNSISSSERSNNSGHTSGDSGNENELVRIPNTQNLPGLVNNQNNL